MKDEKSYSDRLQSFYNALKAHERVNDFLIELAGDAPTELSLFSPLIQSSVARILYARGQKTCAPTNKSRHLNGLHPF